MLNLSTNRQCLSGHVNRFVTNPGHRWLDSTSSCTTADGGATNYCLVTFPVGAYL